MLGYVMQHTFIGLYSWITAMTIKITEESNNNQSNMIFYNYKKTVTSSSTNLLNNADTDTNMPREPKRGSA